LLDGIRDYQQPRFSNKQDFPLSWINTTAPPVFRTTSSHGWPIVSRKTSASPTMKARFIDSIEEISSDNMEQHHRHRLPVLCAMNSCMHWKPAGASALRVAGNRNTC
jgi:hypothetical protein